MLTVFIEESRGRSCVTFRGTGRVFQDALDSLKFEIPEEYRAYNPDGRYWEIMSIARPYLAAWIQYVAENLEAKIFYGPPEPEPRRRKPQKSTAPDPWRVLFLQPDAPLGLVRVVFRYLAKENHPDITGGDHARMAAINAAYEQITCQGVAA